MLSNNKSKKYNTYKLNSNLNLKNTKKNNSGSERLNVSYPQLSLNSSYTYTIPQLSSAYQNQPNITITNAKSRLYLITMTDPDAPSGMKININQKKNNLTKNHTYTHWVYLQDMRKINSTTNKTVLVPYAPPTPPVGIHRYQFRLYDITNVSQTILDTLKNNSIKHTPDRNIYYRKYLQELKKYKINTMFQYKVNSGK
jgi:phosphatidylethanolamine-binding protein (PEBP) family uncharacterized protein